MKYTHIVWDFNGTLLDDIMAGIEAVNDMLSRRGIATIESVAQYRELFCFPIINYYVSSLDCLVNKFFLCCKLQDFSIWLAACQAMDPVL